MNKKTGKKAKRKFSFLLVFAFITIGGGILALLYPIIGDHIANRQRDQAVIQHREAMSGVTQADLDREWQLAKQFNEALFEHQQGNPTTLIDYDEIMGLSHVMGTVDVPALGITDLPFYHGTSYQTLDRGLGHLERSSIPIGGVDTRGVITGHSGVTNQVLFSEINRLQEGDIFFINILGERLAYEIRSFEEILPSEVERVNIKPDEDMMTLLTCTPPGLNTYRLLVNGYRIDYEEAIQREVMIRNLWSYERVVLSSLALLVVFALMIYLRYRQLLRQYHSEDVERSMWAKKKLRRLLKMIRTAFGVIVVGALCLLALAIYGYMRMRETPDLGMMNISQFEENPYEAAFRMMEVNYEDRRISSVNITEHARAQLLMRDTVNHSGIGRILLPDVGIDLPILAGLDNIHLLTGVATYRMNQRLGQDNYVLLAHYIYNEDVLLGTMRDTRIGDRIYVTDFISVYAYQVISNRVVLDTEVMYLEESSGDHEGLITLIRCEGDIGTIYRRVVQGELIEVNPLMTETLAKFNLARDSGETDFLVEVDPLSLLDRLSIQLTAEIVSNPLQTAIPLFFFLMTPILLVSLLPGNQT